jgi:peptide/nickel transport system substrate-binding protein
LTTRKLAFFFNTKTGPCADINFRAALSYAFPYEQMMKLVLGGYGEISHGLIPAGVPGFAEQNARFPAPSQDMAKAREYLAKSAYPNGTTVKCRYIQGDFTAEQTNALYKAALAPLNINLEVQAVQLQTMGDQAQEKTPPQDVITSGWYPVADWALDNFQSTYLPNYWDFSYWSSPETTKMINQATAIYAVDQKAAIKEILDCWDIISKQYTAVYAVDTKVTPVVKKTLHGFKGYVANDPFAFNFYDLSLAQ